MKTERELKDIAHKIIFLLATEYGLQPIESLWVVEALHKSMIETLVEIEKMTRQAAPTKDLAG